MWHWPAKKMLVLRDPAFISTIVALLMHGIGLAVLLVWYCAYSPLQVTVHALKKGSQRIVLMPFQKRSSGTIPQRTVALASSVTQPQTKKIVKKTTLADQPKRAVRSLVQQTQQKKAGSSATTKKNTPAPATKPTPPPKTVTSTAKKQQTAPATKVAAMVAEPKKVEVVAPPEPPPVAALQELSCPPPAQSIGAPEVLSVAADVNTASASAIDADTLVVGQEEWHALQLEQELERALESEWRPPQGMGSLQCQFFVAVESAGAINSIELKQSSGVLAYDLAARMALERMSMPRIAYGKQIYITFN